MSNTAYSVGTVTVTNGGTTVTGSGTRWIGVVYEGDLFTDPAQGLFARVLADASDDEELQINAWPGTALSGDAYEVLFASDAVRQSERTRQLLEQLSVVQANGRGLFYRFSDTITDADPGAGLLRLNNASPGSATASYLDNLDADGATVSAVIDTWDDNPAAGKGQLWLRSVADPAAFHAFAVTGSVVDGTGYRKVTLTYVGGSGSFADGDELMVMFSPAGQAGIDGPTGADGGITMIFDNPTTAADPGAGKFRLNHATHASATALYVDNAEALGGGSIAALVDTWDDSTATVKGTLQIIDQDAPANWRTYQVTGSVVDSTGYRTVTIAYVAGNGTLADEATCSLFFSRTGNNGTNGTNGTNGVTAGLRYLFSTTTTDSDPGTGNFRLNNASAGSATAAFLDNVDNDGATVTGTLDTWDDSTATVRGVLTVRSAATPATFAQYNVTGSVVDGTGYRKLTLAHLAGNGAFGNGDAIAVQFSRTGNDGAAGFPDIDRRNQLLIAAGVAKALAGYQRHLDMVAIGFKASGDIDASSTGVTVDTTLGCVKPDLSTSNQNISASSAGTLAFGSQFTIFNMAAAFTGGDVIRSLGYYSTAAQAMVAKIGKRNSAGNFDVVVSQAFSHPGGGWYDVTLSADYTVPGSGSFYHGASVLGVAAIEYANVSRGYKAGDITGTGQSGFTEDSGQAFLGRYSKLSTTPANGVAIDPYQTADAARTKVRGIFEIDPVDAITLGTDWTVEYTCNGGTSWHAASTYTNCGKGQGGRTIVETEEVSCTSGTSWSSRKKNLNNKRVNIYKTATKAGA